VPQTPVTTPQQPSTSVVDTLPVVQGQLVGGTEPLSLAGGPLQARTSARAESADTKLPGSQVPLVVGGVLVLLGAGALTETGLPRSVTVAVRRVQRLRRWRRGPAKIRP
jgi:hypothetical protein